jgi:threonine dehydrogenase-like Zn-dependent dehydrogenase
VAEDRTPIDAVGMEAHGATIDALYDRVKQAAFLATDRLHVLRQAIQACRKGGIVSIPGVYGGVLDKVPFGAAFSKGLTLRMGQQDVQPETGRLHQDCAETRRPCCWRTPTGVRRIADRSDISCLVAH